MTPKTTSATSEDDAIKKAIAIADKAKSRFAPETRSHADISFIVVKLASELKERSPGMTAHEAATVFSDAANEIEALLGQLPRESDAYAAIYCAVGEMMKHAGELRSRG